MPNKFENKEINESLNILKPLMVKVNETIDSSGGSITPSTLTYSATPSLDMAGNGVETISLTGNAAFTITGLSPGKEKSLRIISDGTLRTLSFPVGIKFIGAAAPTSIAASTTAILSLYSYGTTAAEVVAAYQITY